MGPAGCTHRGDAGDAHEGTQGATGAAPGHQEQPAVTLFPDYPPLEDGAPQSQRRPCCEAWIAFTDQYPHPPPVYVVVHSFAHGRIPFTIDALMERGDTNEHGA